MNYLQNSGTIILLFKNSELCMNVVDCFGKFLLIPIEYIYNPITSVLDHVNVTDHWKFASQETEIC